MKAGYDTFGKQVADDDNYLLDFEEDEVGTFRDGFVYTFKLYAGASINRGKVEVIKKTKSGKSIKVKAVKNGMTYVRTAKIRSGCYGEYIRIPDLFGKTDIKSW